MHYLLPLLFRLCSLVLIVLALFSCQSQQTTVEPVQTKQTGFDPLKFVDPFIGTDGKGKTYPGATVPYGRVQLSPNNGRNGWDWISGYFYPDNVIAGFAHQHLSGTGAGDLYDILFMPVTLPTQEKVLDDILGRPVVHSKFSHAQEEASPGYYKVHLLDYDIDVELTSALRTGAQRYTFNDTKKTAHIRLDLGYSRNWDDTVASEIEVIDPFTIQGYRLSTGWAKDQRVYFYTRFSQAIDTHELVEDKNDTLGLFSFNSSEKKQIEVMTAISSVSIENAKENFHADISPSDTFETIKGKAQRAWRKQLGKIQVSASDDNMIQFYTALYHASLAPRIFSDVNGEYKGPDGNIHKMNGKRRYSFFSLWDTFRALHPWNTLYAPETNAEMMHSLMAHYDVTGLLPVWNFQGNETNMMMGYHAVPVLVDAYLKGTVNLSGERLLEAAIASATQENFGIGSYQSIGYVPYEETKWNVSKTLEYAFDDWAIHRLAAALNKKTIAEKFRLRSLNYHQHFDLESGFMRAKSRNGEFRVPFDPLAYRPVEDYCEANAWQYTFFVPHDVKGLISLYGSNDKFTDKLDEMFSIEQAENALPEWISGYIGQYVHGNEPAHHVPYLYQYVGQSHKTQALVRKIMDTLYSTEPDGLCGNEDAGQMSAWYLFSALGFYPVDPVSGEYVLGSPEINKAIWQLDNGNTLHISAKHQSAKNVYVKSVRFNGEKLQGISISHSQLMQGGQLEFEMSDKPYEN
ncbi:GH92 family glycosyl hydrolase [Agaribacter flavus]|uniref:GH92 family glycosyl hydrolase n=1 Tax=Agaribacter flavus TaxID=1902781 RepID=A0ABV7FMN6_9ALTE